MARKRLTNRVLEGIEAALNAALAGPIGDGTDFSDEDGENMDASLSWIHGQDVRDEEIATLRAKLAEAEAISVARGDWLDRIAKAVGYDASASPADVLQRIDDMREEEVDQAEIRATVRVRLFDLGVINDMDAYTKVLQGVADGANRINHSEHHYDPAAATMRVYMEWSELYIKASNLAPPGS
jgi:hypothetical protein